MIALLIALFLAVPVQSAAVVLERFSTSDFEIRMILDLPPNVEPFGHGIRKDGKSVLSYHVHCPEELNGGGYRDGKFVYLKDVK